MASEYFSRRAKEFIEAKAAAESNAMRLENLMLYAMNKNQFEKLSGNDFVVSIRKSQQVKANVEATQMTYLEHPELHRVKYEFDKVAIKEALKAGFPVPFAEMVENQSLQFKVKKEIKS
jgi:hypothetical protein